MVNNIISKIIVLTFSTLMLSSCATPVIIDAPPKSDSYSEWSAKMALIPEMVKAHEYCEIGLIHYRDSKLVKSTIVKAEKLNTAEALFAKSADQLYIAWEKHPDYKDFILLEIDKIYGYINTCISKRPSIPETAIAVEASKNTLTRKQR